MAMNAAAAYKDSKILTATPAELTLMLYEGAVKFCNLALLGFEKRDYGKVNINIIKTERIVSELRSSLDHKYPIAESFDEVYAMIYKRLIQANLKKDPSLLEEALSYIREMRDTWKEVMRLA